MAQELKLEKLAMIGCGSMGGGMGQLFADHGYQVGLQDPSTDAMDKIVKEAKENNIGDKVHRFDDYSSLCKWLGNPKVFVWSLPHGTVGDKVLDGLMPYLKKGDIIIDAANEHWENSERRQGKVVPKGIRYIAMGVSGGYQAARRGPSCCPSGDDESLDLVLPHIQKIAAKDAEGRPCAQKIGTGSAGHYVKMIHNGIEHGMMAAISEAWGVMTKGLKMPLEDVAKEFYRWNDKGEFKNTFLVRIGGDICSTKDPKTDDHILDRVEDKVVQDVVGEEGTGVWSNEEEIHEHIPAPTLTVAHYLRIASADLAQRRKVKKNFDFDYPPQQIDVPDKAEFLESLRIATYAACLASYIEGMNVIWRANKEKKFNINFDNVLHIWHAGCIIQTDYITRELMEPIYKDWQTKDNINPLYETTIAKEFQRSFPALKKVVLKGTEGDHIVPTLSATLAYLKIQTSTDLPTSFLEAELDYFGNHRFDEKGDDPSGKPQMGKYTYEWKAA
ncbi:hypothetical protein AMS68_005275 [Peltaster fructicola]|uniref:phosphogluconate dehydrogenase (NADP(+)-dependent, decarboxylating) n=1 Tax=Peltaster fructicola TaxID=286661 RepID=A0A6H0XYT1_9PEZI|nr:hypothetical protein AMS68_005275 [Peltaster fructicola]